MFLTHAVPFSHEASFQRLTPFLALTQALISDDSLSNEIREPLDINAQSAGARQDSLSILISFSFRSVRLKWSPPIGANPAALTYSVFYRVEGNARFVFWHL